MYVYVNKFIFKINTLDWCINLSIFKVNTLDWCIGNAFKQTPFNPELRIYWRIPSNGILNSRISGGTNHLFRRIIYHIHGHGKWFLKKCISFLWSEEIIVIGYNLVSFLHNFMKNISVLTKCNVLFNNEHLILICFFLLIDNEFDFKITLRISNPENHQVY